LALLGFLAAAAAAAALYAISSSETDSWSSPTKSEISLS